MELISKMYMLLIF